MKAPSRTHIQYIAFAVALASVSCQMAGAGSPGSCTRTDTRCIELGAGHLDTEYPDSCVYPSVYSPSPCPSRDRVGRCVETTTLSGMVSVVTVNYYQPETTGHAESDCLAAGMSIRSARTVRFSAE